MGTFGGDFSVETFQWRLFGGDLSFETFNGDFSVETFQ